MSWDYVEIPVTWHPRMRPNGRVCEHILVAEKQLGRYLFDGEVVHHIDEDKRNNVPENLMVFRDVSDHSRFHGGLSKTLIENVDGSWTCPPKIQVCVQCDNDFIRSTLQQFCSETCRGLFHRRCDRPSAEELGTLLRESSFSAVGKIFGVSDNAIRKWCKHYQMSTKSKDYR